MKKRVLVVDDDPAVTGLFKSALHDAAEFEVREENNGRFTLESARDFQPDLIFLDRHLPGIDPDKVLSDLRSDSSLAGVPIVIITGGPKSGARVDESNGEPWLYKPFFHGALVNCARRMLKDSGSNY